MNGPGYRFESAILIPMPIPMNGHSNRCLRYECRACLLLTTSPKVALLVEEEPPQGALICVQVEHPVVHTASDDHVLRPTIPQLLPCVTNGAESKEVVEGASLTL